MIKKFDELSALPISSVGVRNIVMSAAGALGLTDAMIINMCPDESVNIDDIANNSILAIGNYNQSAPHKNTAGLCMTFVNTNGTRFQWYITIFDIRYRGYSFFNKAWQEWRMITG